MRGVFNPDSPMMRALGVVWDLIALNLLFLVCCIPVVTIGDVYKRQVIFCMQKYRAMAAASKRKNRCSGHNY